jgi:hypothetical protein
VPVRHSGSTSPRRKSRAGADPTLEGVCSEIDANAGPPAPASVQREQRRADCSYPCEWALRVPRSRQRRAAAFALGANASWAEEQTTAAGEQRESRGAVGARLLRGKATTPRSWFLRLLPRVLARASVRAAANGGPGIRGRRPSQGGMRVRAGVGLFMALDDLHAPRLTVVAKLTWATIIGGRWGGRLARPASAQDGAVDIGCAIGRGCP